MGTASVPDPRRLLPDQHSILQSVCPQRILLVTGVFPPLSPANVLGLPMPPDPVQTASLAPSEASVPCEPSPLPPHLLLSRYSSSPLWILCVTLIYPLEHSPAFSMLFFLLCFLPFLFPLCPIWENLSWLTVEPPRLNPAVL